MEQISFAHISASNRWKAANEEMVETYQRSGKHISWSFAEERADNSTSREEKREKNFLEEEKTEEIILKS